jgi:ATP-dependent RNA helicase RhlE
VAITFVTPSDGYHIQRIESMINEKIAIAELPNGVAIEKTPYEEAQRMAREIDRQKRREDPTYKGAFHERKR